MTNHYPYPFNIYAVDPHINHKEIIILEYFSTIKRGCRKFDWESKRLGNETLKICRWAKRMIRENPNYEIYDTRLIFRPYIEHPRQLPTLCAQLMMKKKSVGTSSYNVAEAGSKALE